MDFIGGPMLNNRGIRLMAVAWILLQAALLADVILRVYSIRF